MKVVKCDYCNQGARLVSGSVIYPHRRDLASLKFWHCEPCNAYVGCHKGTSNAFGRLANADLRKAKMRAHAAFDPIWKARRENGERRARKALYQSLAGAMGIDTKKCHIGMFNEDQCAFVVDWCVSQRATQ